MLPQPPESSPYPLGSSPQTLCLLTPHPAHSCALHPADHSCPRPKPHCWLTSTSRSHPCPASRWCLPPPPTPHGLPVSTTLLLLPAHAHVPPVSRGCTPLLLGTGSPHSTPMAFSLCQAPPRSPASQPTLEWHQQDLQHGPSCPQAPWTCHLGRGQPAAPAPVALCTPNPPQHRHVSPGAPGTRKWDIWGPCRRAGRTPTRVPHHPQTPSLVPSESPRAQPARAGLVGHG